MTPKHQFVGTSSPRTHFDRQVRQVGGTSYVALGRLLPKTWQFVRIRKVSQTKKKLVVSFEKLYEEKPDAQDSKVHKRHQQDTPKTRTTHSNKSTRSKG